MRIRFKTSKRNIYRTTSKVKIQRAMHNSLVKLWKDAIRVFIRTVLDNIGVRSGMSGATLKPLAKEVRLSSYVEQSLRGKGAQFRKEKYLSTQFPGITDYKSMAHGAKLGGKAYTINYGTHKVFQFDFTFEITVLQFYLNELGIGNNNEMPWFALEKGQEAAIDFINANIFRYFSAQDFIDLLYSGKSKFVVTGELSDG